MAASYPAHREADVVLRDGSTARLRPVRPEDEEGLRRFLEELSEQSRAFRFFAGGPNLDSAAADMARADYRSRYGLLVSRGAGERPIAHGMYVGVSPGRAEVAFAVADEMQGLGLGTILLAHLAEAAAENGIEVFEAEVLPGNHRMIEVFRESGIPVETASLPDAIHIELPTSFSPEAVRRFEDRDRVAAEAAVGRFLDPRSIAVVGASRRRGTVGGEVFHNLLAAGGDRAVHPVNPAAPEVQGVAARRSVAEIPGSIDLGVIAVPARDVVEAARQCAAKGATSLIVLSAGFAETGEEGREREGELLRVCREAGMRLIGPNCLGVLSMKPERELNATFAPETPPAGNVGFVTQSGALGLALIELAAERGLGISSFASIGNRADITGNDFLEHWESDPATDVALLYIESFSDPRRFSRLARRIGRSKPIVVVKGGRSVSGGRATGSHTGAVLSASDVTADALFEQSGVIRTETLSELLDVSSLLSSQPLPRGRRVGIVTNAGGPGIMCADACETAGLEVPEPPEEVKRALRALLPPEASPANPIDMIATAGADAYRATITTLAAWEGIDALIVIFVRPLLTRAEQVAEALESAVEELEREIPVMAAFMSRDEPAMGAVTRVPTFRYPEDAARALGRVARYGDWRRTPAEPPATLPDARADEAAAIIAAALDEGANWLDWERIARLLSCYGIPLVPWRLAQTPGESARAASELGDEVALKAIGPEIVHKTELGAVKLGLAADEVAAGAEEIDRALAARGLQREAFLVQRMVSDGVETLAGVVGDPVFGPVLAFGAGGTQVELLGDIAVRLCPIGPGEAKEMLRSLKTFPLLTGFRGAPEANLPALEELLLRLSAMVEAHHEIAECDLNPVVARPEGAIVLDARVRVSSVPPARPWPRLWR